MPQIRSTEKVDSAIHSDKTQDRDANGQQTYDEGSREKRPPMSEEQFEKAMAHLASLPAVLEHRWNVSKFVDENGARFVLIKDSMGALIRKIPELDLWTLSLDYSPSPKGHLFKKTA